MNQSRNNICPVIYSKLLSVPYLTQPTYNTCQSTVLKMYSMYLSQRLGMSSPAAAKEIEAIQQEMKTDPKRPVKGASSYLAHANFVWWMNKYFTSLTFKKVTTKNKLTANKLITGSINSGFPVIVSTSHSRTRGHIILVIGYKKNADTGALRFICNDPYGKFDPSLNSKLFSKRRYTGGMTLLDCSEEGPGKQVTYNSRAIMRSRKSDKRRIRNGKRVKPRFGNFEMISPVF